MSKVILMCGKICAGKSTYAEKLRKELMAAVLSVDEITLALFGQHTGEKHDEYVEKLENYLYNKSLDLIETGINVILDWGFWTRAERKFAKEFYRSHGIECELHYIDVCDKTWRQRLSRRNAAVERGEVSAYYVDDGLAAKFGRIFEPPDEDETDLRIKN